MGSAALVWGLILVAAWVYFTSVALIQIASDSCDLGLTIRFVKIIENRIKLHLKPNLYDTLNSENENYGHVTLATASNYLLS